MAESGEAGDGRMAEPLEIVAAVERLLAPARRPLAGRRAIVTSGPTHEPIDPVRYIANRSSGRQGHAIAAALARLGADVGSSPARSQSPIRRASTVSMSRRAARNARRRRGALPADIAVMVAAVADWRVGTAGRRQDQEDRRARRRRRWNSSRTPTSSRPSATTPNGRALVVGFAAETERRRRQRAAQARPQGRRLSSSPTTSRPRSGVMGGARNRVHLVTRDGVEDWPEMSKDAVAERLAKAIAERFAAARPACFEAVAGAPFASRLKPAGSPRDAARAATLEPIAHRLVSMKAGCSSARTPGP